jgi:hypothetical protein
MFIIILYYIFRKVNIYFEVNMKTFTVESIEQFNILAARLQEKGYKPWQYQDDNGFRTWFAKAGKDDIEVVTHSEAVRKAIMEIRAT